MIEAPYGSWRSPITAELISTGGVGLASPRPAGERVYWLESRPAEGGRTVVVCRTPAGATPTVTPDGANVRSRVNEYGGGAWAVHGDQVFYSDDRDRRVYRQDAARPQNPPAAPLTPEEGGLRYGDLTFDPAHGRLLAVCEAPGDGEPENRLVAIDPGAPGNDPGRVLAAGHDFFASPRPSPDGRHLAWLAWDHPDMPWDAATLWLAEVAGDGSPGPPRAVAGGPGASVFQPEWGPDGALYFVGEASGWWNLYRLEDGTPRALAPMEAEFGRPQWQLDMRTYAFGPDRRLYCTWTRDGLWHLGVLDPASGALEAIPLPYTDLADLAGGAHGVYLTGAGPDTPREVVHLEPATRTTRVLARASRLELDPALLSRPRALTFPTEDGEVAHGFFYPPTSPDHRAPEGTRAPQLVRGHGGPSAATGTALNLGFQFWASRGIGVLDVNYRGSTGYGRAYRERLYGAWGVADVADCVHGARHLADTGEADPRRLAIRGSSAGGYTALAALAFHDTFRAGASLYGIGELAALAEDTHKFESRYLERLVGPWPEAADTYRARSPLHHLEGFTAPAIFLQGLEDRVVPPSQAEAMVAALEGKGIPVAYVTFPDEQHGFRRGENIRRALEAELYFYGRVFGFTPADPLDPVPIRNL